MAEKEKVIFVKNIGEFTLLDTFIVNTLKLYPTYASYRRALVNKQIYINNKLVTNNLNYLIGLLQGKNTFLLTIGKNKYKIILK